MKIVDFCSKTRRGSAKETNEDAFIADPDNRIFLIADGMTNCQSGDFSSKLAASAFHDFVKREIASGKECSPGMVEEGFNFANSALRGHSANSSNRFVSTLTALVFSRTGYCVGHIGDCRLHVVDGNGFGLLTHDHNLAQELIDIKRLTEEQARTYPLRNMLMKGLGMTDRIAPDIREYAAVTEDSVFVLCSDGLIDQLSDVQLEEAVMNHWSSLQSDMCDDLFISLEGEALTDDATILCVRVLP